jgi:hypothetical protein
VRPWTPAPGGEVDKALTILRWLKTVMEERTRRSGGIEHKPSPKAPVILLVLDEMVGAIGFSADPKKAKMRDLVNEIYQSGAKAGVVVAIAGQRGVSTHTGSRDPHANSGNKVLLRVANTSEMGHVLPDWQSIGVPDMSTYGQGAAGVVCIVDQDNTWQAGRSHHLDHKAGIPQGVAARRGAPKARLEPWLVEKLHGYTDRRPAEAGTKLVQGPPAGALELDQADVDRQFEDITRSEEPRGNVLELVIDYPERDTTGPPEEFVELVLGLLAARGAEGARRDEIVAESNEKRYKVTAWLAQMRDAGMIMHNGKGGQFARWVLPSDEDTGTG